MADGIIAEDVMAGIRGGYNFPEVLQRRADLAEPADRGAARYLEGIISPPQKPRRTASEIPKDNPQISPEKIHGNPTGGLANVKSCP